ncbi:helix-turn-helix domain-containing protein [Thermoflavimicrobium dichotomicum]|uniref:Helix-turn-helix domain-containing protein n=1 Tax=Thermoflavimicrobium dichotomicum TaxID=46223 RepID=A0A1I3JRU2_9BACL|nr:helix-turn-helix domain-containing protein [Thermoflavimicrobium dichotomicum]SFI62840.1 Helix-turn-helix domain-containing protein [Thermoflavimicrobium dichotomicum]
MKAELLLHPIRMRIIRAFVGGRNLTAQQLIDLLPDIPQATLYRHVNKLLQGGILQVVQQRQIRGALERVYALAEHALQVPPASDQQETQADYGQHFLGFLAVLQSDFQRYMDQVSCDTQKNGIFYQQVHLNLSDDEFQELIDQLHALIEHFLQKEPSPKRRARIFSTIVIPDS